MIKTSSPTFKRAAFVAAAYVSASVITSAFMYWKISSDELDRFEKLLEQQASALSARLAGTGQPQLDDGSFNETYRLTQSGLFDAGGVYVQGNLRGLPSDLPLDGKAHFLTNPTRANGYERQTIYVGARLSDQRILVIGRDTPEVVDIEKTVKTTLLEGVIPLSLIFIGVGAIASRQIRRRLRDAQSCLDEIKAGDLQKRLSLSAAHDELDSLAQSVNEMLAELERAIKELHHVGNHIAHDIRAPLLRVRGQIELAQSSGHMPEHLQNILDVAVAGLDQTLAVATAMLRLAQIEAGTARPHFRDVDLLEILRELIEFYEPLAECRDIKINLRAQKSVAVRGDRDLLMEAISNLIDNAIKFSPSNGLIELTLTESPEGPAVHIRDLGPGIPDSQKAAVFERFYRCCDDAPGTGLGLTLVAAIARLHDMQVEISDGTPGCTFELRFSSAAGPSRVRE